MPDIPKSDDASDLYATLEGGSDSEDGDSELHGADGGGGEGGGGVAGAAGGGLLLKKHNHPYAKVKKKIGVEHPYATVKKAGPTSGSGGSHSENVLADSSEEEEEEDDDDDDEDDGNDDDDRSLLRPGQFGRGGSRPSSNRSSRHNVDGGASSQPSGGSRQPTPLPNEPATAGGGGGGGGGRGGGGGGIAQQPHVFGQMQNPNMHFSGDSQDSSKGYTSITVREPVRHIQLQRSSLQQDATYATVSETSDEMYAAIEDPTYVPTGTSQSNSDTYAIIDLPEESEVDFAPPGSGMAAAAASAAGAMHPRSEEVSPEHHTYSKVNKPKKRAGPQVPAPNPSSVSSGPMAIVRRSLDALGVEGMYAKVQKRPPGTEGTGGGLMDDDLDLPVGASAMNPSSSTGARPKVRGSLQWVRLAGGGGDRRNKTDLHFSDYDEATHYNQGSAAAAAAAAGAAAAAAAAAAVKESGEGGYETLPEEKHEVGGSDDAGYEVLPESEWKRKRFHHDAGYETVPPRAPPSEESGGGYECVPEYWRSTNSNGGYETVKEGLVGKEPGYEVVKEKSRRNDDYDSIDRNRRRKKDPDYEKISSAGSKRMAKEDEPPYETAEGAEDDDDREMGYETISQGGKRILQAAISEYDPGYEVLENNSNSAKQGMEPGYETVQERVVPLRPPDYETVMRGGDGATTNGREGEEEEEASLLPVHQLVLPSTIPIGSGGNAEAHQSVIANKVEEDPPSLSTFYSAHQKNSWRCDLPPVLLSTPEDSSSLSSPSTVRTASATAVPVPSPPGGQVSVVGAALVEPHHHRKLEVGPPQRKSSSVVVINHRQMDISDVDVEANSDGSSASGAGEVNTHIYV